MRKTARYIGANVSTISRWRKKDPADGWRQIPTKSSKPKHHLKQLKEDIVKKIIKLRFQTKHRCSEVIHQMLLNEGVKISINSVRRTIDRHGLMKKRSPWKRYHPHTERLEALNPGDLIQVDTVHLMKNKQERIYAFTLIDVFSRWVYARAYERANCRIALHFLRLAQFYAWFKFNNIQKCLRKLKVDVSVINKALPEYLKYYNNERFHLGINLLTPLQMLQSYWG